MTRLQGLSFRFIGCIRSPNSNNLLISFKVICELKVQLLPSLFRCSFWFHTFFLWWHPLNFSEREVRIGRRFQVLQYKEAGLRLDPDGREVGIGGPNLREAVEAGQDLVAHSVRAQRVGVLAPGLNNQVGEAPQLRAPRFEMLCLVIPETNTQLNSKSHHQSDQKLMNLQWG